MFTTASKDLFVLTCALLLPQQSCMMTATLTRLHGDREIIADHTVF